MADDIWKTPDALYKSLDDIYHFDFDPCPYNDGPITDENDGLIIPWGKRNFVNPPYSRPLKDLFVHRSIREWRNGALCVLLLPVVTSSVLFHDHIKPNATDIRFVRGRIRFEKRLPDGTFHAPKDGPRHDSMIVVFGQR